MKQRELHSHLVRLCETLEEHEALLESEFEQDAEGFPILPKGVDGEPIRVLQFATGTLTRIIYRIGNERIEGDPDLPERFFKT
jgi:hypothetical protein